MTERSEALPRGMYRDPCEVLISRESRTCAGCWHMEMAIGEVYCEKGKQYGRRCNLYSEVVSGKS